MSEEDSSDDLIKYQQSLERLSRLNVSGPHCDPRIHGFTNGDIVKYRFGISPISIVYTGKPVNATGYSSSYVCVVHTGELKIEMSSFFPSNIERLNKDET